MNRKSLTIRTVRTTVISCLLLGLIALVVGLSVYTTTLASQYVWTAFETAKHATNSVTHGSDSISLARQVMEIYRSLTPEQRAKMETDREEYRSYYVSVDTAIGRGGTWDQLINQLDAFMIDVDDVYLGMYDEENSALVYFANADDGDVMYPGDWETVYSHEARSFLHWDGTGMLYEISHTERWGWLCTAGYPIRDESGEIVEFVLVDVEINTIADEIKDFFFKVSLGNLIATGLMVWFIRRRIKKTVADPIDAITRAAVAYVKGKKEGIEGEYFSGLNIHSGDELENLSHVMADMEKDLAVHEDRIRTISAREERVRTELIMAARIQESMLPSTFPAFPDRTEFDIYASMSAAREVGGDFYDFFLIDEDHLCLVIADVSGKGVPAALFMMTTKGMIRDYVLQSDDPAQALILTNEAICANNPTEMFVTIWIGILEISSGKLTAASAGHEFPALYTRSSGYTLFKDPHGLVAGGMPGIKYTDYELQLTPGDRLFLYTDGVPEAADTTNELFGTDRMLEALNTAGDADPRSVLSAVDEAVSAFVKGAERFDDLTMLCFEYKGGQE